MSMSCRGMTGTVLTQRVVAVDVWKTRIVRFTADHHFTSPPEAVAGVLLDGEFHRVLELPDVALPTVVASGREGSVGTLRLRYEFVGHLDPIARRMLGGRALAWEQELRLDTDTGRGVLTIAVDDAAGRIRGDGRVTLEGVDAGTVRRIVGELQIRIPLIGGNAERRIVPGIVSRLDVEAEAVRAHLGEAAP